MDTSERIVEAYVRYIKGWATIPNIRCPGQNEIDLLAIDPVTFERYHIEVSIHTSDGFSKLNNKAFDPALFRERVQRPKQRRTLGFFIEHKFNAEGVISTLQQYGFQPNAYKKVVVSFGWTDDIPAVAKEHSIELWDVRDILNEIADYCGKKSGHFADDTLRILQLFCLGANQNTGRRKSRE